MHWNASLDSRSTATADVAAKSGSLLQAAIDRCKSRGDILVVQLTVTDGNEPAYGLYRSAGFEPFGTEPMAIRTPAGFRSKVHMWLDLSPLRMPQEPITARSP